jgi:LmbE family N-acetylglucosaminyl deacetylase
MAESLTEAIRTVGVLMLALSEAERERDKLRARLDTVRADTLEEAAVVAEEQPFYPDTHTGMRQGWVKTEIARKLRALAQTKENAR